jgi:mannan endo-1,4-beta-mannosidase
MGQPWNFAGYNLSCQQPFTMSAAALQYYLEEIVSTLPAGSSGAVVRMWWFQSDMGTGSNPWAPFDQIVAAAKAAGVTIIPTLTNQWQTCDEPAPTTSEKLLSWYQGGYEQPEGGYSLSYKQFALAMAAHFADDPTIAFWQLVNEAEAPTSAGCEEAAAATALRAFGDDMAVSLHQVDPNHLVNLGTEGAGECGTAGTDYSYVQAGALDLCEIHDYSNPAVALPSGPDSMASDITACHALGKPIFVGEAGIPANVQPDGTSGSASITNASIAQRAKFFQAKIDAFDAAGGAGYVIWFKSPFYTLAENKLDIPDGDPTEAVLPDALVPDAGPPTATPELPWPAGAVAVTAVGAGAVLLLRRRGRARRTEAQTR